MNPRLDAIKDAQTVFAEKISTKKSMRVITVQYATPPITVNRLNQDHFITMIKNAFASYLSERAVLEKTSGLVYRWMYPHGTYGIEQAQKFLEEAQELENPADIFKKIKDAIEGPDAKQLFKKHLAYHFLTIEAYGEPRRCENDDEKWYELHFQLTVTNDTLPSRFSYHS